MNSKNSGTGGNEGRGLGKSKKEQDHFRGCLIGGAIGDAFGQPVEFMSYNSILDKYGEEGITSPECSGFGVMEITDDTQMTLFTAEGILRGQSSWNERGICHLPTMLYYAYLRWLATQGHPRMEEYNWIYDGWLFNIKELHQRRAPGNTCMSALASGSMGSPEAPLNNSKGCGGVMRVAPVGLIFHKGRAFEVGMESAAITHGHPSGYLPAGALAYIIASIIEGQNLEASVTESIEALEVHECYEESTLLLKQALELAGSDLKDVDAISRLGEGC